MSIVEFVLEWPIPNKKNSRRNYRGISLPSKKYVERNKDALQQLAQQDIPVIDYPIILELDITVWTFRKKDWDGVVSSIFDTLQDGWYIADDSLFYIPQHKVTLVWYDKNNERNVIRIKKVELPLAIKEFLVKKGVL